MLMIRDAHPQDLDQVAFVHARSWQEAYRGLVPDDFLNAIDPAAWAARYRNRQDEHRSTMLALDGAQPVGMISFGPDRQDPEHGEVYAIYVLPERQGQGIGRRLMHRAMARLEPTVVRLWCAAENTQSRRFYESYGFNADGVTGTYEIAGIELMTVRYTLTRVT